MQRGRRVDQLVQPHHRCVLHQFNAIDLLVEALALDLVQLEIVDDLATFSTVKRYLASFTTA